MKKKYWDDYSQEVPFENIRLVFSNRKYNIKDSNDLERFSKAVGLNPKKLIILKQIHSSNIISPKIPGVYDAADGIINKGGELVCAIQVADCLPIFFVNNNSKIRSIEVIRTPTFIPLPIVSEINPTVISRTPISLWAMGIIRVIDMTATNKKQWINGIS